MVRLAVMTSLADKGAALVGLDRPEEAMGSRGIRCCVGVSSPGDPPSVAMRVSQIFVNTGPPAPPDRPDRGGH